MNSGYALDSRELLECCAALFGVLTHCSLLVFSGRNDSSLACPTPEAEYKVPGKPAGSFKTFQ